MAQGGPHLLSVSFVQLFIREKKGSLISFKVSVLSVLLKLQLKINSAVASSSLRVRTGARKVSYLLSDVTSKKPELQPSPIKTSTPF